MDNVETSPNKGGFEVLHTVANRIRLRAVDSKTKAGIKRVAQQLEQQEGIIEVSTKEKTGSLVVTFDPDQYSLLQLQEFLSPFGLDQNQTENSAVFAQICPQLKSFIPSVVGIVTTRSLGFYGWPALGAYLVTTKLTREIMGHLDLTKPDNNQPKTQKLAAVGEKTALPYRIIHQVPGRIRLQIPYLKQNPKYGKELRTLALNDPRIINLTINSERNYVILHYQPNSSFAQGDLISLIELAALKLGLIEEESTIVDDSPAEMNLDMEAPVETKLPTPNDDNNPGEEAEVLTIEGASQEDGENADEISENPRILAHNGLNIQQAQNSWLKLKANCLSFLLRMMANLPVTTANS